jgi:hypothetical protein
MSSKAIITPTQFELLKRVLDPTSTSADSATQLLYKLNIIISENHSSSELLSDFQVIWLAFVNLHYSLEQSFDTQNLKKAFEPFLLNYLPAYSPSEFIKQYKSEIQRLSSLTILTVTTEPGFKTQLALTRTNSSPLALPPNHSPENEEGMFPREDSLYLSYQPMPAYTSSMLRNESSTESFLVGSTANYDEPQSQPFPGSQISSFTNEAFDPFTNPDIYTIPNSSDPLQSSAPQYVEAIVLDEATATSTSEQPPRKRQKTGSVNASVLYSRYQHTSKINLIDQLEYYQKAYAQLQVAFKILGPDQEFSLEIAKNLENAKTQIENLQRQLKLMSDGNEHLSQENESLKHNAIDTSKDKIELQAEMKVINKALLVAQAFVQYQTQIIYTIQANNEDLISEKNNLKEELKAIENSQGEDIIETDKMLKKNVQLKIKLAVSNSKHQSLQDKLKKYLAALLSKDVTDTVEASEDNIIVKSEGKEEKPEIERAPQSMDEDEASLISDSRHFMLIQAKTAAEKLFKETQELHAQIELLKYEEEGFKLRVVELEINHKIASAKLEQENGAKIDTLTRQYAEELSDIKLQVQTLEKDVNAVFSRLKKSLALLKFFSKALQERDIIIDSLPLPVFTPETGAQIEMSKFTLLSNFMAQNKYLKAELADREKQLKGFQKVDEGQAQAEVEAGEEKEASIGLESTMAISVTPNTHIPQSLSFLTALLKPNEHKNLFSRSPVIPYNITNTGKPG